MESLCLLVMPGGVGYAFLMVSMSPLQRRAALLLAESQQESPAGNGLLWQFQLKDLLILLTNMGPPLLIMRQAEAPVLAQWPLIYYSAQAWLIASPLVTIYGVDLLSRSGVGGTQWRWAYLLALPWIFLAASMLLPLLIFSVIGAFLTLGLLNLARGAMDATAAAPLLLLVATAAVGGFWAFNGKLSRMPLAGVDEE